MPDELDKSAGEEEPLDDDGESDRPTVSPPFDPADYARKTHDAHTHATPPQGTAAQQAVLDLARPSLPPESEPNERKTAERSTPPTPEEPAPDSIRSLAARRLPSHEMPRIDVPPPAAPARRPDSFTMGAVEREWAKLEAETRRPPADAPHEDPVIEVSTDVAAVSLDLDDVDLEEHDMGAAHPPPEEPVEEAPPTKPAETAAPATPHTKKTLSATPAVRGSSTPKGPPTEQEMNDRVSVGDYSGALEVAERLLAENPSDAVRAVADNCRAVLRQMYATRIGPLDRVPMVAVARDQLRWLSIDHKAGFVLSLVDGVSSLEMIIDVSGMPQLDTLRILSELVQQRIISLR